MENNKYIIPEPIVNQKEKQSLIALTARYERLIKPRKAAIVGKKIEEKLPEPIKKFGNTVKETISEAELYAQCVKIVAEGFSVLEKYAAKTTISSESIVAKVNRASCEIDIKKFEEICLARSYDIAAIVEKHRPLELGAALIEGGGTGYFGFAGLPFNLVLSTFLYYRAVQSVAMFYGYDVKNSAEELVIAGEVFMNAISPTTAGTDGVSGLISKVMVMTELTAVKQTAKKTWGDMISHGGLSLLLAQMRALANGAARKALEQAGQKGLENSLFHSIFEQIGKKLSKKVVGKAMPYAGAIIGALFDTAQMNTIVEYADVFYNKRYIAEKEMRVALLCNVGDPIVVDAFIEVEDEEQLANEVSI